jgi:hypothetical protein
LSVIDETRSHTKTLSILTLAFAAAAIYLISVYLAYTKFNNTRLVDPLAEVNSLFPLYYVAIGLAAATCIACFFMRLNNKYLHMLLVWMFAMMLWFTPYYLAGFVRLPDGPWHVGVGLQISEVMTGATVTFSEYAWSFPGSFIYHRVFLSVLGIEPTGYIALLFPFIWISLFVLLWYVLVAKLFDAKVAFLSLLIAIPGLHYIQSHPSPHTLAALLMLSALLLALTKGTGAKVLAIAAVVAIIISHPTTPLLLAIFLTAALLTNMVYSRRLNRTQVALASILLLCFVGWYLWMSYYHTTPIVAVTEGQFPHEVDVPTSVGVSQRYLTGTAFVYAGIFNLNKAVYFFYAVLAVAAVAYVAAKTFIRERRVGKWIAKLGGIQPGQALMAMTVPPLIVLSVLLAETAPCLLETGLTFAVLALSCVIASVIPFSERYRGRTWGVTGVSVLIGLLFLTFSFPTIAYYIDAYSSFPESEERGLRFVAASVPLDERTLATNSPGQLAPYLDHPLHATVLVPLHGQETPDFGTLLPHVFVFRSTGYYYAAMRHDLSFEDNRYSEYSRFVDVNEYDKVYSNPTFEVYSRHGEP